MMNWLRELVPEILGLEESPVEVAGRVVGWHVNAVGANSVLGAGAAINLERAKRIAIAEVIERKTFRQLAESESAADFQLDKFPTSCGFAAGFEKEPTRLRSIAEAIERWAWSKWIDEGYVVPEANISVSELSDFDKYFFCQFDRVSFFKVKIDTSNIQNFGSEVELIISIGFKGDGVFPGSRVSQAGECSVLHPLIESWRHLILYQNQDSKNAHKFPFNRINFFGNNSSVALRQIANAKHMEWATPKLLLSKPVVFHSEAAFVWRSLVENYVGWEKGSESRFVY